MHVCRMPTYSLTHTISKSFDAKSGKPFDLDSSRIADKMNKFFRKANNKAIIITLFMNRFAIASSISSDACADVFLSCFMLETRIRVIIITGNDETTTWFLRRVEKQIN